MTTSETEIRIPCKDTADFGADVLLQIEDDVIFFEVDDIRGRGGRGYLTPDQARQTAAALVRIATTLDPPPRLTDHVKALAHLHSALDGLDVLLVDSSDVTEHITTALDYLARVAAPEGEPFAVGDIVRLRDGVLPSLTTRVGPLREIAADRAEAIVDLGDGGQLWVQFSEIAGPGTER